MDRFFLESKQWSGTTLRVSGDEGHHATRVMRKKVGDEVEIFDGEGRWVRGEVTQVGKGEFAMEVGTRGESSVLEPAFELAVAIPKGKTMDLIVQKSVELGVTSIQPLITANTVVRLGGKEREEKVEKWQRVALEACKQCGQNVLPTVKPVRDIGEWLDEGREGLRLIASLADGTAPLRETLCESERPEGVVVLVGPEGDFTEEETGKALGKGFSPVTLGDIILRVETACLYLMVAVRYQFS